MIDSSEIIPYDTQVAEGRRLVSVKEFGLALTKLRDVDVKLGNALMAARAKKKEWDDLPHKKLGTDLTEIRKNRAFEGAVSAIARQLDTMTKNVALDRKYDVAIKTFTKLQNDVEALMKDKKASESDEVKDARTLANTALTKTWAARDKALNDLKNAMKRSGSAGEDLGTWDEQSRQIQAAWEGTRDTAKSVEEVGKGQTVAEEAV